MQPLFTVHVGEYLVGDYLERRWGADLEVWLPSRDRGVDLLVTCRSTATAATIQVKYSKDYVTGGHVTNVPDGTASGWWKFAPNELQSSPAEFWVLVIAAPGSAETHYIIVKPEELLRRLVVLRGDRPRLDFYLAATDRLCIETRGLPTKARTRLLTRQTQCAERDFSSMLNNWNPLLRKLKMSPAG